MDRTLTILNELVQKQLLESYAIGGAMAWLFYTEPAATYDLDVFCTLPEPPNGLISLSPIYEHLHCRGYAVDREHILVEGVPVQLIPAYNPLITEAVKMALDKQFKAVPTRVLRPEHLLAIMLQTGREKDRARALQVHSEIVLDASLLQGILSRHALADKWKRLTQ